MDHVGDGQPPAGDASPDLPTEIEWSYRPAQDAYPDLPTEIERPYQPAHDARPYLPTEIERPHQPAEDARPPAPRRAPPGPRRAPPGRRCALLPSGDARRVRVPGDAHRARRARGGQAVHPEPRQAGRPVSPGQAARSGAGAHQVRSRGSRHPADRCCADGRTHLGNRPPGPAAPAAAPMAGAGWRCTHRDPARGQRRAAVPALPPRAVRRDRGEDHAADAKRLRRQRDRPDQHQRRRRDGVPTSGCSGRTSRRRSP